MNHERLQDLSRKWVCGAADDTNGHGDVKVSYGVQWKTVHHPNKWKMYSVYHDDLSKCLSSLKAASQVPNVIELRIMKKTQHYEAFPDELMESYLEFLKGEKADGKEP